MATELTVNTRPFERGMRRADRTTSRFQRTASSAANSVKSLGLSLVAGLGARQLIGDLVETTARLDDLGKTASSLDVGVEQLQRLRFAAGQTGVETEQLDKALANLSRRVSEAATGTGEGVDALEALGLEAEELLALPVDRQFAVVADAINAVENASDRARISYDLFGRQGVSLLNTLALGADGLDEMGDAAERLGAIIGEQNVRDAERLQDAIGAVQTAWQGFTDKTASEFAPTLADSLGGLSLLLGDISNALDGAFGDEGLQKLLRFTNPLVNLLSLYQELRGGVEQVGIGVEAQTANVDELAAAVDQAAESVREVTKATDDMLPGQREWQRLLDRASEVYEATRTPAERYLETQQELEDLLSRGLITQETYERALADAQETLDTLTRTTADQVRVQRGISGDAGQFQQVESFRLVSSGGVALAGNEQGAVLKDLKDSVEEWLGRMYERQLEPTRLQY